MKKLIFKGMLLFFPVLFIVAFVNYNQDPACLFHYADNMKAAELLANGQVVSLSGYNAGLLHEARIARLEENPNVVIFGSSHVLFLPWDEKYPNCYDAAVIGCNLDYYYGILSMFRHNGLTPKKIILTAEPWFFTSISKSAGKQPIQAYIDDEELLVAGEIKPEDIKDISTLKMDYSKVKELFSITYFQASISNDWVKRGESEITIYDNLEPGDSEKVKPNMIRIPTKEQLGLSIEQINADADFRIANGLSFELDQAPEISEEGAEYFENLVRYLVAEGYDVELYFAPLYPKYYDYMINNPNCNGVFEAEEYVRELGNELDILVYGSYNPYAIGIDESDFMDTAHIKPDSLWKTYVIVE